MHFVSCHLARGLARGRGDFFARRAQAIETVCGRHNGTDVISAHHAAFIGGEHHDSAGERDAMDRHKRDAHGRRVEDIA